MKVESYFFARNRRHSCAPHGMEIPLFSEAARSGINFWPGHFVPDSARFSPAAGLGAFFVIQVLPESFVAHLVSSLAIVSYTISYSNATLSCASSRWERSVSSPLCTAYLPPLRRSKDAICDMAVPPGRYYAFSSNEPIISCNSKSASSACRSVSSLQNRFPPAN